MGIVLAFYFRKEGPQREEYIWEDDDDTDDDTDTENPYWDVPEPDKDELTVIYRFRKK